MGDPKLVMPQEGPSRSRTAGQADAFRVWAVLGWVALTFIVVGGVDFALTWYPANFGSREWEFGTVTASFNGLPILLLGVGLLLASGMRTGRRWQSVLAVLGAFGLALWIIVGAGFWAVNVPVALTSVPPEVLVGIKKSVVKTAFQSAAYPLVFLYLGIRGLKELRGG